MRKLSKSQFMHKVINDKYDKQHTEREKLKGADNHIFENINKIRRRNNGK
ncbi:hypothetical protein SAMN02745163_03723 [Clostridium cavendishii DSM 21758]|uniref:Uncharacterized protein n=1 Tax=Clostridium cavendishii DSM 21758 TaxID=1121302 RepID=A0A1M6S0N9_9CLOT|nr:hypothetical protein [Clostridium cavendishii]SHK38382.1 hypothetical protein SAMN02745163_03723 [Clostridium cavendishii DSM 21758]